MRKLSGMQKEQLVDVSTVGIASTVEVPKIQRLEKIADLF